MKAIRIHSYGDSDVLRYEEAPTPQIGPDEVLIKVRAAGINPVDWKVRQGYLKDFVPHELPLIPGWDVAGIVERVGALVTRFKIGDSVYSRPDITRNGTYAEYVAVRSDEAGHAPKRIPLEHAAGIPLAALTAWMSLFDKAGLRSGQSVLIHAAAGGVGSFAVQLAKIVGAMVITTTSAANTDLVMSLGADETIDYRSEDSSKRVKDVDVVFDTIGAETQTKSWSVLRKGGILVSIISAPDKAIAQQYDVRGEYVFVTPNGARLEEIAGLVDAGKLRVVIGKEFPLDQAKAAHELSQAGHARGKIILRVS
jgi:NADPH:quinone reductase-like Zn-dependent oxidoreductase